MFVESTLLAAGYFSGCVQLPQVSFFDLLDEMCFSANPVISFQYKNVYFYIEMK